MVDRKLNLKEVVVMAIQLESTGAVFYRRLKELAGSIREFQRTMNCEQE